MTQPQTAGTPVLELSETHAQHANHKGSYTKYTVKGRVACHECVAVLHEARGKGPLPRSAAMQRKTPDKTLLICHEHTESWRALDAVNFPKSTG